MGGSGPTRRELRTVGLVPRTSAVKSSPIPISIALVNLSSLVTIMIPGSGTVGGTLRLAPV
eukprot:4447724-Heterocapsa_arctica.AAC.1